MESWSILDRIVRGVVRRRKRLALITGLVALFILMPVAYLITREPPRYRASAVVVLESRPDRVQIFPDLAPNRPLAVQMAILGSRSLAETVVENLPSASLQEILETSY